MGAVLNMVSYSRGPISRTSGFINVNLESIYRLITGDRLKERTEEVRKDKSLKNKILPYFTPCGTFTERKSSGLIKLSDFLVVDIDGDISIKDLIASDEFIKPVLVFTSPSGKGIKILVHVTGTSVSRHLAIFHALNWYIMDKYKIPPDLSGSDIPRACFLCHDPEAYYFPEGSIDAETLLSIIIPETAPAAVPAPAATAAAGTDAIHRVSTAHAIGRRPSDELNRIPAIHDRAVSALLSAGWKQFVNGKLWTKPNKSKRGGCTAIYNLYDAAGINIFKVFSDNAAPFLPIAYTDVGVINVLEYNGEFRTCIRELAGKYLN